MLNPYKPGAGHTPPFLAGRDNELGEFRRLITQETILENMVLTGLRGVGKTVLLDEFKPIAITAGWLWAGTDLSESTSVDETTLAIRLFTDLSLVTAHIVVDRRAVTSIGFEAKPTTENIRLDFATLFSLFKSTPGLVADKLKWVLEFVWKQLAGVNSRGVIFAYDEAQNMSDRPRKEQYPLSLLLDVFQSIQRKGVPFMLVLTGLPTLFPNLVEARTFAERMFRVVFLDRLSEEASEDAILKPTQVEGCPIDFDSESVRVIRKASAGYPYFIQFICRESFDALLQRMEAGGERFVPLNEILKKLDVDFFAGRWARATDRQRELLSVIANLEGGDEEFTVQEVVEGSRRLLDKPFSSSHVNQMLSTLSNAGLIYKNRHGKYSFAVPLLGHFIRRRPDNSGA